MSASFVMFLIAHYTSCVLSKSLFPGNGHHQAVLLTLPLFIFLHSLPPLISRDFHPFPLLSIYFYFSLSLSLLKFLSLICNEAMMCDVIAVNQPIKGLE